MFVTQINLKKNLKERMGGLMKMISKRIPTCSYNIKHINEMKVMKTIRLFLI